MPNLSQAIPYRQGQTVLESCGQDSPRHELAGVQQLL
jgi:hypothetical protein